jgi:hypothetical protein
LFRVTLRRLDLAAEIYHLREPQKIPQVISPDEARRLLAVANSLRTRLLLKLASCRNRRCPKCQGAAARQWLAERQAELLPVPYFHVVFTLPAGWAFWRERAH